MEKKVCTKCNIEKELLFFRYRKDKLIHISICKSCEYEYNKKWSKSNPKKIKNYNRKQYINNNEKIRKSTKAYSVENKEYIKIWRKNHYKENSEKIKNERKEYYRLNKEKVITCNLRYTKKRRETDIIFKLLLNMRCRIFSFVKKNKISKTNSTIDIIGIPPEELKKYIEKQFTEGMSWDNYGYYGWHIDHIIPLSSAKTEKEVFDLCYYKNLQPLWREDNLVKGNKV